MATRKRGRSATALQQKRSEQKTERSDVEQQAWRKLKSYIGSWPTYARSPEINPYLCVEPEVGKLLARWNRWGRRPSERILSRQDRRPFFEHLKACRRCQESLNEQGFVAYFIGLTTTELTPQEQQAIKRLFVSGLRS